VLCLPASPSALLARVLTTRPTPATGIHHFWRISSAIGTIAFPIVGLCYRNARSVTSGRTEEPILSSEQ
jgi:hypothetical protein